MKKILLALCLMMGMAIGYAHAQSFKAQFNALVEKKDTLAQQQLLEKWEKADANDPELYTAYFNYYVSRARNEMVILGQEPKGETVFALMPADSSNQEPAGYLYSDKHYNSALLKKGFTWIERGIEKFPNRLDMRFGKVYMFGEVEDYENFTNEIIRVVERSAVNQNQWTWTDNAPVENPQHIMLSSIQDYQFQLYNTEDNALLDNMKRIAEAVLKHYPDHVESLSDLSVVLMLQKQYDAALEPLLRAEKINPKDAIVLGNIAQAYKLKGDAKMAIKYYELTMKYGDEDAREYAKSQIEELKRK